MRADAGVLRVALQLREAAGAGVPVGAVVAQEVGLLDAGGVCGEGDLPEVLYLHGGVHADQHAGAGPGAVLGD